MPLKNQESTHECVQCGELPPACGMPHPMGIVSCLCPKDVQGELLRLLALSAPVIPHCYCVMKGEEKCHLSSSVTDQAGPNPRESPSTGVFPKGGPRAALGDAERLLLVPGPVAPSSGCWQSAGTSLSPPRHH